jgi:hypothetical protein
MQPGERTDNRNDLSEVELHCFLRLDSTESAVLRYSFDDGESLDYRTGARSSLIIEAWSLPDGGLSIRLRDIHAGAGPARIRVVVYDKFKYIRVAEGAKTRLLDVESFSWTFTGRRLRAVAGPWLRVGPVPVPASASASVNGVAATPGSGSNADAGPTPAPAPDAMAPQGSLSSPSAKSKARAPSLASP